mmetsp:Transcript_85075/g.169957  ORF Transcript_85075/g.169957 Transcript_85075/m.169957 type:complete len:211 (+) Transcript_85075:207-839(+)
MTTANWERISSHCAAASRAKVSHASHQTARSQSGVMARGRVPTKAIATSLTSTPFTQAMLFIQSTSLLSQTPPDALLPVVCVRVVATRAGLRDGPSACGLVSSTVGSRTQPCASPCMSSPLPRCLVCTHHCAPRSQAARKALIAQRVWAARPLQRQARGCFSSMRTAQSALAWPRCSFSRTRQHAVSISCRRFRPAGVTARCEACGHVAP